jgi:MFS transporter, DHA3 family, macrolide efflux protein
MQQLYSSREGRSFLMMWLAHGISSAGSRLTFYAFGIWWFQQTGLTTPIFLTTLAVFVPSVLLSPLAGVIVDRNDRRTIMLGVNLTHICTHSAMLLLIAFGERSIVPLLALLVISGCADTFQYPALYSSISLLVPKDQLGQANGLYATSGGTVDVISPLLGAFLVTSIGMEGILLIDLVSFVIELAVLLWLRIPRPEVSVAGAAMHGGVLAQARQGFGFIFARSGLFSLQLVLVGYNFFNSLVQNLQVPLVLSRFPVPEVVGIITASYGVGVILGGLYMTRTGGVRPRVHGVFVGVGVSGLLGITVFGVAQSLPIWILANLIFGICLPILSASSQSIWQQKTPIDIQGRVFAARRLISHISIPIAYALGGFLSDGIATPVFSRLESSAWLLGGSDGRGYAAMFVICGVCMALSGFGAYLRPAARNVERDVPDA